MSKTTWVRAVEIVDKHNLFDVLGTRVAHAVRNAIYNALEKVYANGVKRGAKKEHKREFREAFTPKDWCPPHFGHYIGHTDPGPQEKWKHLVFTFHDENGPVMFEKWMDTTKPGALHINGVAIPLKKQTSPAPPPQFDEEKVRGLIKEQAEICRLTENLGTTKTHIASLRRQLFEARKPTFDAEKVRGLMVLYGHNKWQEGRQFGPNENSFMSCADFFKRAEYYHNRLLTALGLDKGE